MSCVGPVALVARIRSVPTAGPGTYVAVPDEGCGFVIEPPDSFVTIANVVSCPPIDASGYVSPIHASPQCSSESHAEKSVTSSAYEPVSLPDEASVTTTENV